MDIQKVLTLLPEDQWASAKTKLENMPKAQRDVLLARLSPLMNTQGGNTNAETIVSGSTPAGTSTFPKNNPMGNQPIGSFEGKIVYKNSKGQNYYFTGKGGAAIIGGDKVEPLPVPDNVEGIDGGDISGVIGGAAVGAGAGTLFWLNRLKKIRESFNKKAPAYIDKTRRYIPESNISNLSYDNLKTKLKTLTPEKKVPAFINKTRGYIPENISNLSYDNLKTKLKTLTPEKKVPAFINKTRGYIPENISNLSYDNLKTLIPKKGAWKKVGKTIFKKAL